MEKQKAAEENRNSKKMARLAIQALEDKKAEEDRKSVV